ncbi:MAG: alpha/beta fold hydrolase [Bacillales bacterium]|nr:alpha/beta fold hydrolase [Bacillales bacterium]
MFIETKEGKIHIEEKGKKDGFPILFLHGNREDISIFKDYVEPFSSYRLILIDSRGHGESFNGELSYEKMAEDTIEVINALQINSCHMVGFSDGAIISLLVAIKTHLVKKLFAIGVNINPLGFRDEAIKYLKDSYQKSASLYDKLMLEEPDIKEESLQKITAKVFIIGGENDLIKEEHFRLIHQAIKSSSLYILKGKDHFTFINEPPEIIKIIKNELSIDVFYEDNQVIVVDKPSGVLSQKDISEEEDMLETVKSYLKIKYDKPGNVYLGLIQRLDRNVSGLMLFAKTSKAAARLNTLRPEKEYLAVVEGKMPKEEGTLKNYLLKDEKNLKAYESKEGKIAVLHYSVLSYKTGYTLLKVIIDNGRFHQIRFQLSLIGHPIYNDMKYKGLKEDGYDLGLDAHKITFIHPITKEKMTFDRFPDRYPFNIFLEDMDII